LPPTLVITATTTAPERLQALADLIAQESAVEQVAIDLQWVKRLQALMALGRKLVTGLTLVLGLGVLVALGNTIRLAIESRRDEIVIIKLVGGTDGFVRRPFLYTGAWYGLFGGLLACALVTAAIANLASPVSSLAGTYNSDFRLQGLDLEGIASLLAISTGLGFMGAWLAVGRHLSEIEPK
jgi:cell division transport system permease protein